jgi:hypothetical protein
MFPIFEVRGARQNLELGVEFRTVRRLEIRMLLFLFCVLVVALAQSSYFACLRGDPGLRSDLRSHREVTFSFFPG